MASICTLQCLTLHTLFVVIRENGIGPQCRDSLKQSMVFPGIYYCLTQQLATNKQRKLCNIHTILDIRQTHQHKSLHHHAWSFVRTDQLLLSVKIGINDLLHVNPAQSGSAPRTAATTVFPLSNQHSLM